MMDKRTIRTISELFDPNGWTFGEANWPDEVTNETIRAGQPKGRKMRGHPRCRSALLGQNNPAVLVDVADVPDADVIKDRDVVPDVATAAAATARRHVELGGAANRCIERGVRSFVIGTGGGRRERGQGGESKGGGD